jgi:hypothetical protein
MRQSASEMVETLERVQQLVRKSAHSPWSVSDPLALAASLEKEIKCLRTRGRFRWFGKFKMKVLFAPAGDLQEISIFSGWDEEFLELSSRFDDELARL